MSRLARARVATVDPAPAKSWDKVLEPELSFEFEADESPDAPRSRPGFPAAEKASVKDAIIRWLDEQL